MKLFFSNRPLSMTKYHQSALCLGIALAVSSLPGSLLGQSNPDPSANQLTSFKMAQGVPAGSANDPAYKLPGRDTYVMTPDRTGMVRISPSITHTYTGGNPTIRLIDGDGVVIHTFPSSGSSFSVPSIKFNKLLHVVVFDPTTNTPVANSTIVTGDGGYQDGPGYITGPSGMDFGIPEIISSSQEQEGKDGEGEAGEDYGSCKACTSSCDLSNGNDGGDVTADGPNGGFTMNQPAGNSMNGDSQTQLDASVDPTAGIQQGNMQVHGNGDANVTRDTNNRITSVATDSTYTKVESVTTQDNKSAVRLSQWKSQAQSETSTQPFRVVTYINSNTNEITRTNTLNGGSPVTTVWSYDSANKKWTIEEAGLRKKVLTDQSTGSDPTTRIERHELFEKNAAGTWVLVSDVRKTFVKFQTGWKKTKVEVFGLANNPLVTEWEYWGNSDITGAGSSTNGRTLLKKVTYPDGKVVEHEYEKSGSDPDPTYTHSTSSSFAGSEYSLFKEVSTTSSGDATSTKMSVGTSLFYESSTDWSGNTATNRRSRGPSLFEESTSTVESFGDDFGGRPTASIFADGTASETTNTRSGSTRLTTSIFGETDGNGNIVDGTESMTSTNKDGVVSLRTEKDVASDQITSSSRVPTGQTDPIGRPLKIEYHMDSNDDPAYWEEATYACCGLSSVTDKYGVVTSYAYDALKRVTRSNSLGVTRHFVFDGMVVHQHRYLETVSGGLFTGIADSDNEISNTERDVTGTIRYSRSRSPQDGTLITDTTTTTTLRNPKGPTPNPGSLPAGIGRRVVRVLESTSDDGPSTPSETTDYFLDRREYQTTGNLSTNVRYSYAVGGYDWDGGGIDGYGTTTTTTVLDGFGNEKEKSIEYFDYDGVLQGVKTDWSGLTRYFYTDTHLTKSIDADGVTRLYGYNKSRRVLDALDLNGNGQIDYGTDQIKYSRPIVVSGPAVRTDIKVWQPGAAQGSPTIVSRNERALSGLSSSKIAFPTTSNGSGTGYGTDTRATELGTQGDGDWTETTIGADGVVSRDYYDNGRLVASTVWAAGTTPPTTAPSDITNVTTTGFISGKSYGYDTLGRTTTVTDSRTGTVTIGYYSTVCDAVASKSDAGSRVTAYTYDHRGRRKTVDLPDSLSSSGGNLTNVTTTTHFIDGSVKLVDGGQTYKTSYTYDYAGRMKTLTTYGRVTATTTWNYSATTGQLTSKTYPDGYDADSAADPGPTYYYTAAGRLKKRVWARGNTTRYDYDAGGRLTYTRYFTAATTQTAVNAAATGNDPVTPDSAFIYDALGRLEEATNAHSSIEYGYHADLLTLATETLAIDPDGSGTRAAVTRTFERGRDSLLRPDGYLFKDGSTVEAEVTYGYDATHGLLDEVSGVHAGSTREFNWTYEPEAYGLPAAVAGPQHVVALDWKADRDVLHSRANSERYGDNTLFSSYEYAVNDIGQRTGVTLGGDQFSVTGIAWGYDSMGQVTTADRAGGTTGDRGYKWDGIGNRYISSRNTTNPDAAGGSNISAYKIGTTGASTNGANALNQYRRVHIYGTTGVNQTYDLDGNQDSGRYPAGGSGARYWDGENRMYRTTVGSANTYYAYDPFGRRVAKYQGTGTGMTGRIYFYDGWNVAAECSIASSTYPLDRTYTWGPDLSGSMQGAGGVGGLLAVEIETGGDAGVYYPTYDGNGNVSEYLDASAVVVAHFEYDPFGEEVVATGSKVALFNYRFSTKPLDTETGYYYYGYRFYDPVTGRWPSRDPIEEDGGVNLYGFIDNDPANVIDNLGLHPAGDGTQVAQLVAAGDVAALELLAESGVCVSQAALQQAAANAARMALAEATAAAEATALRKALMEAAKQAKRLTDEKLKELVKDPHKFKAALKKLAEVKSQLGKNTNFDIMLDSAGKVVLEGNMTKVLIPLGKTIEELSK